jgi:hypothetical protein
MAGSGVYLRTMPPDMFSDWHTAPRKQIVPNGESILLIINEGIYNKTANH